MRIGYFIPCWPPETMPNGIATALGRLSDALEQLGHEVFFLTPQVGGRDPRVSAIRFKTPSSLMDRLRWRFDFERTSYRETATAIRSQLQLLLAEKKIQIFEMEESFGWVGTVAIGLPIPVVIRLHGPWFAQVAIKALQRVREADRIRIDREGLAIRSAFAVSAPSQAVLSLAHSFCGNLSGISKVIPNAIPLPASDKTWNYEKCDKSTILFVGRFDEVKGADVVLRAFSELIRARPNSILNFVGPDAGVRMQNGQMAHFSEFVRSEVSIESASRVKYLGTLPRREIDELRRMATLTVVASRYETFPNIVGEAMAVGSPIIATNVGGIPEMLENYRNAILIEPENPGALVSACLTLIDNPQLAIKLAKQARIDCSIKLRPETVAQQHVEFYAKIIDQFSQRKTQN